MISLKIGSKCPKKFKTRDFGDGNTEHIIIVGSIQCDECFNFEDRTNHKLICKNQDPVTEEKSKYTIDDLILKYKK